MLKNKFGMLKVVALALTVLMLATLVACNKGMDDAAIQDAINAAVSSNAAEQEKVAQSLADAQAKAEAEAQAKAEAAEKAAAEAQAKAEAAEKAAAEAKKKAEEEAKAAAESAKKAQEAADAAKKEAEKLASSISQSQKDAATATTAPAADADAIAAINAEFAKMKYEYLTEKAALYLSDNLKEMALTFDKAAVELQNAKTKAAAESAFESLKVAVAAIESVQTRADAVQALIADLGDIESAVFTAQVEKITAARDAYKAFTKDYAKNTKLEKVIEDTINYTDLVKAESKLEILEDYIAETLSADMLTLVKAFPKNDYDAEDDRDEYGAVVAAATYKYRLLEVINDGNVAAANVAIDWDFKLDSDGDKIPVTGETHPVTGKTLKYELDKKAPIAYFTAEELKNIYILPTLDADFADFKTLAVAQFETALNAVTYGEHLVPGTTKSALIDEGDIEDIFDDAIDAFAASIADLTFVGNYKGNKIFADAKKDIYGKFAAAYVDAVMEVVETSKAYAIELYTEDVYEEKVETLNDQYDEQPAILANYLAKAENDLNKFTANVNSAPIYDYAGITAKDVIKTIDKNIDASKFYSGNGVAANFYTYVSAIVENSLKKFALTIAGTQDGTLGLATEKMIADLTAFRDEWTDKEGAMYDTLAQKKAGSSTATPWNPDSEPTDDTWKKATEVAALEAYIDAAIASIKAIDVTTYADKEVNVKWKKDSSSDTAKKYSEKALYFVSAEAKQYFDDMGYTEADFADNFNDVKVYFTYTANDMPLTYTFTAEEQAIEAAQNIYVGAWKQIYTDVIAIMDLKATYEKKINNNDGDLKDSTFEKALAEAAGADDLQAEITAFGSAYLGNIATVVKADNYKNALGGKALYTFFKKSDTITKGDHVTLAYEAAEADYASELFTLDNIKAKLQAEVDTCSNNVANVSALYTYRFVAIDKINAAAAAAKYVYTTVDGVKTASGAPIYAYTPNSAAAALYEAKIDELAAAAVAKIKAVKLDNTEMADLSAWNGTKIWSKAKLGFSYDKATQYIDAIVTNFIGTSGTAVVIGGTTYDAADSQIFQQYKMLIKNNYSGWASLEKAN